MSRALKGVGVSLRRQHYADILGVTRQLDWLEIQPENFMGIGGAAPRLLDACAERWVVVPHGVGLSVGGPDPFDRDYLMYLQPLLRKLGAPYFSEHACFSSALGEAFHDLVPLPFTEEAADHLARRTRELGDRLDHPIVLENITYYAEMPGSAMSEGEFLTRALDEADAGLLLDVNNIYVNATNHGRDPRDVLDELPLHRTRQIHLAGHTRHGDILIDDHGSAVCDEVWDLYRHVIGRLGPVPTLIEWENGVPTIDRLLDEVDAARTILEGTPLQDATAEGQTVEGASS